MAVLTGVVTDLLVSFVANCIPCDQIYTWCHQIAIPQTRTRKAGELARKYFSCAPPLRSTLLGKIRAGSRDYPTPWCSSLRHSESLRWVHWSQDRYGCAHESYWIILGQGEDKVQKNEGMPPKSTTSQLLSYLDEFMWRERYGAIIEDVLANILRDIALWYPV